MTPKEISDIIETAIAEAMKHNEGYEEGDLLIDWVTVAYVANADEDKGGAYPVFFANGSMPTYKIRGLFATALLKLDVEDEIEDEE